MTEYKPLRVTYVGDGSGRHVSPGGPALGAAERTLQPLDDDHTVGRRYAAFAIGLYSDQLHVLTLSDESLPSWDPVDAFADLDRSEVPNGWHLSVRDGRDGWTFLVGFPELAFDTSFHARLIELEDNALQAFLSYAEFYLAIDVPDDYVVDFTAEHLPMDQDRVTRDGERWFYLRYEQEDSPDQPGG